MIKLVQSGLFGDRLFKVDKSLMVKRYNSCLEDIGLKTTKLSSFHIDGLGWSPEVAEELDDRFYLSHGLANPYGIIISPEQKNCSLYLPYHTFDWDIHEHLFDQYLGQITDISAQCGIWYEMDQDITAYRSPKDLLMMEVVHVKVNTVDKVVDAAAQQKALISAFNADDTAWMDKELRNNIIDSGKKYGDLRYRKFELPEISVTDTNYFYTQAFEGVFVLKDVNNQKPLLVFQNNSSKVTGETKHSHVEFNLNDNTLLPFLYNHHLVNDDYEYFKEFIPVLELYMEYILAHAANSNEPDLNLVKLNSSQKKGLANKLIHLDALPNTYFDLERIINKIKDGKALDKDDISNDIRPFLLHPNNEMNKQAKIVLWQLLISMNGNNPVLHYLFDKGSFYNQYQTWNENMQNWVIEGLLKHRSLFYKLVN